MRRDDSDSTGTDLPTLTDTRGLLSPGDQVGDYRITNLIAAGGFGAVYRADHVSDKREVAIKIVHQSRLNPENIERFRREVQALRKLDNPYVVKLYDVGLHTDGRPFLVMEYLRGIGLDRLLAERGRLPYAQAMAILDPLCEALAAAHAADIVHRDVKPSNIFLERWEQEGARVVLLDFGLVKLTTDFDSELTTSRHRIGTPSAMAPEQISGGVVDGRTDVYGVGNLAFVLLTGQPPFIGSTPVMVQEMHLHARLPNPCTLAPIETAVGTAILRAMAKLPQQRYNSVLDFRDALRATSTSSLRKAAQITDTAVIAAYFEVVFEQEDSGEDELLDDLENVLALVGRTFGRESFETVLDTGRRLLYLRPKSPADSSRLIAPLRALCEELERRPDPHPHLHWKLCLHATAEGKRDGNWSEALLQTDSWVPDLCDTLLVTAAARQQLEIEAQTTPIGESVFQLVRPR